MYYVKYLTVGFSVDLPARRNNPAPYSPARFQQFSIIERFCVESNKHRDRGAL